MEKKGYVLMEKYEIGKLLGQGSFAKVHHARNLTTGASVAMKIIDKDKLSKAGLTEQIMREIHAMKKVKHPNIVELYEVMATKSKIYFAMEYVKGGELFKKIARGKLKEDSARKYFQQLISAVDYCHNKGVIHRDLKPENLLVDGDGNLKISDFGLSAIVDSKREGGDGLLHTTCGTPAYVAPEVIMRKGYDGCKSDIWSCGVILFVLLAGYLPFHDANLMEMYRKIRKADFKFPSWFSREARKLLMKILDPNPKSRVSIPEIMASAWLRKGGIADSKVEDEDDEAPDAKLKEVKPHLINAFDIISYSSGLDLSRLFEEKKSVRFTSNQMAGNIVSKLEEAGKQLRLKTMKKDDGVMKLEGLNGGKGAVGIEVGIFEVTASFHIVEMKKSNGDSAEYRRTVNDIKPALKDIVWTWEDDTINAF